MKPFLMSWIGLGAVVTVLVLLTVGWLIIRKIVNIDV